MSGFAISLDIYFKLRAAIFDYFGYTKGWRTLPLNDARHYYWRLAGELIYFADSEQDLVTESGNYYENEIRPQDDSGGIYRAADYTLVVVDTHTDGNELLRVFDNALERPIAKRTMPGVSDLE